MRIKNRLDNWLMASTFAEAGEFETAQVLMAPHRQVLLALEDSRPAGRALRCAVSLCRRVDAALDVLFVSSARAASTDIARALADAGLPYRLNHVSGALGEEIVRYVQSCRSVAFVVIDSLDAWGADKSAQPWRALGCPLVVAGNDAATGSH